MACVKQVLPINIEFGEASSSIEQPEEWEILIIEIKTTLVAIKWLCILSVSDHAMSMEVFIDLPSKAASSSSNISRYGLGLAFLRETPLQMPYHFSIDLHGAPLFY